MRIVLGFTLAVLVLAGCTAPPVKSAATPPPAKAIEPTGFVNAHDPVIAKEGGRYYVFTTGSYIPMLCSNDMTQWEFCGRVFKENPKWVRDAIGNVTDLWAPDISFFNGKWHLYYSASTFGKNRSAIGLATNTTLNADDPKYEWVDEGLVIESKPTDTWNAIDPNFALDETGQPWLALGSYWSGLKLTRLDPATGKPVGGSNLVAIAGGRPSPNAIEAPFIFRHGAFFYLFFSVDFCCRGTDSTYNIRVGRTTKITGPYVDRDGKTLLGGGGTLVLAGSKRWRGPGHNAVFHDDNTNTDWLVYHAYDADEVGKPKLRIQALAWDADGWPVATTSP